MNVHRFKILDNHIIPLRKSLDSSNQWMRPRPRFWRAIPFLSPPLRKVLLSARYMNQWMRLRPRLGPITRFPQFSPRYVLDSHCTPTCSATMLVLQRICCFGGGRPKQCWSYTKCCKKQDKVESKRAVLWPCQPSRERVQQNTTRIIIILHMCLDACLQYRLILR